MAPVENPQRQQPVKDDESTPLLPPPADYQIHILPRKRLWIVMPALALVHFTSFLDQTAITTSLPAIASALHTGSSISWVAASFVTASTSIQLISSRVSDIFGRKLCLISALTIMGLGNLLSGFSQTPAQLYATRAFAGFGAGAINALVQIAISDITPLHERGYYFGIVGISVAVGNGLGPVIGGALTQSVSWKLAFWFVCPLIALAVLYLGLVFPTASTPGDIWRKLKLVDWVGVILNMAAIILILIPLSQGGLPDAWKSATNIAMLVTGLLLLTSFVALEFWVIKFPILPILVGLLAGSHTADRAGISGLRNFIRDIGSAVGLTASGAILNRVLQNGLNTRFSPTFISQLISSASAVMKSNLSDEDKQLISETYMVGLHKVFVSYAVLALVLFLWVLFIHEYSLKKEDFDPPAEVEPN
ncbi:putative transporter [Lachnellula willkommii]|uniref:Putative transporter n=1 Tax=Lachnellula willkommii TaxID=215461 RepID=A0A559MEV3_9HELO|nr:putative transporter [Lachnellula willkommii]